MSAKPVTAATSWTPAATTIVSADPRPETTGPDSAEPTENAPTFSPAAVVNTWPYKPGGTTC
jgi:hypothetical protein